AQGRRHHRAQHRGQRAQPAAGGARIARGTGMTELRLWLARSYGLLLSIVVFIVMFALYFGNFSTDDPAAVILSAANTGVLLALVAMAQTVPVLTAGLDLSVGMIFIMTNCIASALAVGTPLQA